MNNDKEGWAIDITNKKATHYYKDGVSLCKREAQKFFMYNFDKDKNYTQVLGSVCSLCQKKLNKK